MTTLITAQTAAAQSDSMDINFDRPVTQGAFDQGNYPQGTTFTAKVVAEGKFNVQKVLGQVDDLS